MAGYSGTPLPKKLGIKPGHRVGIFGAPEGFDDLLHPLPDDVAVTRQARGSFDVIVLFVHRSSELERRFAKLSPRIVANGGFWIGWPKKASKIPTDLAFDRVQRTGLGAGLVDNKICAIDEDYSGLRFVVRLENRDDWPPTT